MATIEDAQAIYDAVTLAAWLAHCEREWCKLNQKETK